MSIAERLTDPRYWLISSTLSTVQGGEKKTLEKSVSEQAPNSLNSRSIENGNTEAIGDLHFMHAVQYLALFL